MRRWLENRLGMLVATCYTGAMARAITALPHDDLTLQVGFCPGLGLGPGVACPGDTIRKFREPKIYATPREQPTRKGK